LLFLSQRLHVLYKIVNNVDSDDSAQWSVVREALGRCGDVRELREMLDPEDMKAILKDPLTKQRRLQTGNKLKRLEVDLYRRSRDLDRALSGEDWAAVLYRLSRQHEQRELTDDVVTKVIDKAVSSGAWHVVSRVVTSWSQQDTRDTLLPRMMAAGQWGVCRALLERGVTMETCLDRVPVLMERNQWLLLARVMERDDVTDDWRRRVVFHAVRRGEGSLVWHGLQMLTTPLTEAERQEMFRLALQHDAWQAVRPLVEQMDELGVQQRDKALRLAVDNHQWSVVDHCMKHRADLNKHVNLALKAEAKDWEAVEELAKREADVSALDYSEQTALHIAVHEKQWKTAKVLIQYHSKLLQRNRYGNTPIRGIINDTQASLIECALFWSPDVQNGRGKDMDTPLHAACRAGWPHTMYYLLARGCDPLAFNKQGHTVLATAVQIGDGEDGEDEILSHKERRRMRFGREPKEPKNLNEGEELMRLERAQSRARRMLAQCIKLGFSTHQPAITRNRQTSSGMRSHCRSPMWHAMRQNSVVLMKMLYESGACSNRELTRLWAMEQPENCERQVLDLLSQMVHVPRSLQSACRLTVSRCFNVRGKRHHDVTALPRDELDDRVNKCKVSVWDYVMFTDLTDPFLKKEKIG
jgi:hypothetical protein